MLYYCFIYDPIILTLHWLRVTWNKVPVFYYDERFKRLILPVYQSSYQHLKQCVATSSELIAHQHTVVDINNQNPIHNYLINTNTNNNNCSIFSFKFHLHILHNTITVKKFYLLIMIIQSIFAVNKGSLYLGGYYSKNVPHVLRWHDSSSGIVITICYKVSAYFIHTIQNEDHLTINCLERILYSTISSPRWSTNWYDHHLIIWYCH